MDIMRVVSIVMMSLVIQEENTTGKDLETDTILMMDMLGIIMTVMEEPPFFA